MFSPVDQYIECLNEGRKFFDEKVHTWDKVSQNDINISLEYLFYHLKAIS